jgi:hypothetical protein
LHSIKTASLFDEENRPHKSRAPYSRLRTLWVHYFERKWVRFKKSVEVS